jgi:hypothetical protein
MEHSYIEEHNIAERYLLGKLSVQEHMRFEEHLNNCAQCVNLLEVIDGLRTGLQIVAAPVFALSATRDGDSGLAQPVNRIKLSPKSKLIVLLLELSPDPGLQSYRAAISTSDGRNIWRERDLKPSSDDALALSFNSGLFKPGNYLLTLEGLTAQKSYVPIAKYTFGVFTR